MKIKVSKVRIPFLRVSRLRTSRGIPASRLPIPGTGLVVLSEASQTIRRYVVARIHEYLRSDLEWQVSYQAGKLEARGYRDGEIAMPTAVETTGAAASLALTTDRKGMNADGQDVAVITVSAQDAQGRNVPTTVNLVKFQVTGGKIIGVCNGDSSFHESDKERERSLFKVLAQVIVQSKEPANSNWSQRPRACNPRHSGCDVLLRRRVSYFRKGAGDRCSRMKPPRRIQRRSLSSVALAVLCAALGLPWPLEVVGIIQPAAPRNSTGYRLRLECGGKR